MEKSQKVTLLASIVLIGFIFGVIYHYILGYYMHLKEPYNTFLFGSPSVLCDFWGSFIYLKDFTPYKNVNPFTVYFPLSYILTLPFIWTKNIIGSYLLFASGFVIFLTTMNIKYFKCEKLTLIQNFQNILILTTASYPVLYLIDRGNFDLVMFVLFGLFIFAFKSEKYALAAVLLALQNACKPFTFLFLLLFLFKKKFKETFLSIILTTILIFGGFMLFKGGLYNQITMFIKDIAWYKHIYVYLNNNNGLDHSSSLFPALKLIFVKFHAVPLISLQALDKIYICLCWILTGITMFFVWREKTFWKQITLLICNMLLTPYSTYAYKLVFLFLPIWLFVNENKQSKFDFAYMLLFGLLFIPKNVLINFPNLNQAINPPMFSLEIFINPLLLLLLSGLIVFEQIKNIQQQIANDK